MCRLLAFLTSSATMKSMASSSWHFFPSLSEDSEAHSIPPRFPLASRAGEDLQEFPCCCEAWESLRIIVGQRGSSNHATFQDWQLALQGMLQKVLGEQRRAVVAKMSNRETGLLILPGPESILQVIPARGCV